MAGGTILLLTVFLALADTTDRDYSGLKWPIGLSIIILVFGVPLLYKFQQSIDDWMSTHKATRITLRVVLGILIPGLITVFADIANLSEIAAGNIDSTDEVLLSLLGPLVIVFAAGQWMLWSHADKWDVKLQKETSLREDARRRRDFILRMNKIFLGVVGLKSAEVRKLASEHDGNGCRLERLRTAVDPDRQIPSLVNAVYELYAEELRRRNVEATMRIALFEVRFGNLELLHSWNGTNVACVQSPLDAKYKDKFNLSISATDCLAVWAAQRGQIEIIDNAEKADRDRSSAFNYYTNAQRNQIKSIVALPLSLTEGVAARFVVMMDSNEPEFFNEDGRRELGIVLENLAHRLLYEADAKLLFEECPLQGDS